MKILGTACAVWTLSFIFKFFSYAYGISALFRENKTGIVDFGLWPSIWFGVSSIIADVVPLYFVLDAKYIKIFTMKHLDHLQQEEEPTDPNSTLGDILEEGSPRIL